MALKYQDFNIKSSGGWLWLPSLKTKAMKNFKIGNRFLFQGTKDEAKAYQKLFFDVERTEIQQINHAL